MTHVIPNALRMFLSVSILMMLCLGCGGVKEVDPDKFEDVRRSALVVLSTVQGGNDKQALRTSIEAFSNELDLIKHEVRQDTFEKDIYERYVFALDAYKTSLVAWDITDKYMPISEITNEQLVKDTDNIYGQRYAPELTKDEFLHLYALNFNNYMPIDNFLDQPNSYIVKNAEYLILEGDTGEKIMSLDVMQEIWKDAQETVYLCDDKLNDDRKSMQQL